MPSLLETIKAPFDHRVGIDLGTSQVRIWSSKFKPEDQQNARVTVVAPLVEETCCLAIERSSQKVIAVGDQAAEMRGRVSDEEIEILFPLRNGTVADEAALEALLKVLLQRVIRGAYFIKPTIMVTVAATATPTERKVITNVLYRLGAREVYTIVQSLAAAIGSGVPIAEATGSCILHLGSGVAECSVISLSSVVSSHSSSFAGQRVDASIVRALQQDFQLIISRSTAQQIKQYLLSADPSLSKVGLVSGQDTRERAPREIEVNSTQLSSVAREAVSVYTELIKRVLKDIPPELTADIIDRGMLLTGGMAQIPGLAAALTNELGVPVSMVDRPEIVALKGVVTALNHLELLTQSLGYTVSH